MRTRVLMMVAAMSAGAFAQKDLPSYETREVAFRHASSAQQFQEIAMVVRVVAELPFVEVMETAGRLRVRGPSELLPTAEWVMGQLDRERAAGQAVSEVHTMAPRPAGEDRVRVFPLAYARSAQALQETATVVRSLSEIRCVMVYNPTSAVVIRGSEEQLRFAEWLLGELDREPGRARTTGEEFLTRDRLFEYPVRVIVLPGMSQQRLQEVAAEVRKKSRRGWLFPYSPLPAIAVRTTREELPVAMKALEEAVR
ncbi:MAG: hypothetical protein J0L64_08905 [Acidobacteria bacterium]|nr:hypothetical protein [Acidobacteriota bacterium]